MINQPEFLLAVLRSNAFIAALGDNPAFISAVVTEGTLAHNILNNPILLNHLKYNLFEGDGAMAALVAYAVGTTEYAELAAALEANPTILAGVLGQLIGTFEMISDDNQVITEASANLLGDGVTIEYTFDDAVATGSPLSKIRIGFSLP